MSPAQSAPRDRSASGPPIPDVPAVRSLLRILIAAAAGGGLLLNTLDLGLLAGLWSSGDPAADGMAFARDALPLLAWGIGFGALALVIVWRVGDRYEVLFAALFVASYSLWVGLSRAGPLTDAAWFPVAVALGDGMTHLTGVRFAMLFPRPLRRDELAAAAPAWARRSLVPGLAALLDPRVYWPFGVAFEALLSTPLDGSARYQMHVLFWCTLAGFYLYASYRTGSAEERRRVFWIMEGVLAFVVAVAAVLAFYAIDWSVLPLDVPVLTSWVFAVASWVTLACFYLAVFQSGALDSSLVLRRTTVISLSSAAAVLIFVSLETLTEELLSALLGWESRAGAIVGGVVAAATFHPLSRRIDGAVRGWLGGGEAAGRSGRTREEAVAPPEEATSG
jgi:hypothetical protein